MIDFWASDELKIGTFVGIIVLFTALATIQRKVGHILSSEQSAIYRKYAADIYVQTVLLFGPAFVAAGRGFLAGTPLTESITSSFLLICLFGGLGALWSTWRALAELRSARAGSNNANRLRRLENVAQMLKLATASAIVAAALGASGLIYVHLTNAPPTWFWFAAFLGTLYLVIGRAWSLAVLAAASRYAASSKLGEA